MVARAHLRHPDATPVGHPSCNASGHCVALAHPDCNTCCTDPDTDAQSDVEPDA